MAVAIIIIMTVLICLSTKESSRVNLVLTCTKLVGVLFVIIAGEDCPVLHTVSALPLVVIQIADIACKAHAHKLHLTPCHGAQLHLAHPCRLYKGITPKPHHRLWRIWC